MQRLALAETDEKNTNAASLAQVAGNTVFCDPSGAAYFEAAGILVVSDLHLEKGAAFARRGRLLPPYDTYATLKILQSVIRRYEPAMVISLGDNFHDRVGANLMPDDCRALIGDMVRGRDWFWITGNHDPNGVDGLPGTEADSLAISGLTFRHEPQPGLQDGEIAGHLHPAATLVRREKLVRRPCFATDGSRLIMPSFGVMTGSLDLSHSAFKGLFDREKLVAHMMGRDRIYPVPYLKLRA